MLPRAELENLLHRDHTRLEKLLIIMAANDPKPSRVTDIEQMAVDAGFREIRDWNVSAILRTSRGRAILVDKRWKLTNDGRAKVAQLLGINGSVAPPPMAPELRAEMAKVADQTTCAFIEEAILAYEYKLYRSAIVMAWLAAVDILYHHVVASRLADFNAEATRVTVGKWKPATNRDGLALMGERDFLDRCAAISVIGKNVKTELVRCLDLRNGCGHPNSLKTGRNAVAHHIEILILNVFQKFAAPTP